MSCAIGRYARRTERAGPYECLPITPRVLNDWQGSASPFDTPQRMAELIAWLKDAREFRRPHPLLIIAVFIVVFLEIHPFQDGNGRLSRILTTLLLLQAGYAYVPFSSLESVIENSKESYYMALRQTQSTLHSGK